MHFLKYIIISIIYISSVEYTFSRSPAVEPFMEIEIEKSSKEKVNPKNPAIYFNFEPTTIAAQSKNQNPINSFYVFLFLGLALPMVSWILVWNHLRTKAYKENTTNVQTLSSYRLNNSDKTPTKDNIKKAS